MSKDSYEPREGGTAHAVFKLLRSRDVQWMKAADLASELEISYAAMAAAMNAPEQKGAMVKFTFEGAVCYGLPGQEPVGARLKDGRVVQADGATARPGLNWTPPAAPPASSVGPGTPLEWPPAETSVQVDRRETPAMRMPERRGTDEPLTEKRGFACALFSDGRWLLEFDGTSITLPRDYAERMFDYIGRVWNRTAAIEEGRTHVAQT